MRVYSPSQTVSWLRCPVKWMLERQGWRTRTITRRDIGAVLGTAFGAGVEEFYKTAHTQDPRGATPTVVAEVTATEEIDKLGRAGCVWLPGDEINTTTLPKIAAKAVGKYTTKDPLPTTWTILDIQRSLPDHGYARPDLIVRSHTGQLGVIDLKFKRTLAAQYRQRTIEEYRHSWQMNHYAWAVGEVYGEPVGFYVTILTLLEPRFEPIFDPVPVDPEALAFWLAGARGAWHQMELMERGETQPWIANDHSDRYGRCEFYGACFSCKLDEGLMQEEYTKEVKS